jgi:hypothetical protein
MNDLESLIEGEEWCLIDTYFSNDYSDDSWNHDLNDLRRKCQEQTSWLSVWRWHSFYPLSYLLINRWYCEKYFLSNPSWLNRVEDFHLPSKLVYIPDAFYIHSAIPRVMQFLGCPSAWKECFVGGVSTRHHDSLFSVQCLWEEIRHQLTQNI